MTSPASAYADMPILTSAPPSNILLPNLRTIRISGAHTPQLRAFVEFRREQGRPIKNWYVSDRFKDAAGERLAEEMKYAGYGEQLWWYAAEEDEERPPPADDEEGEEESTSEEDYEVVYEDDDWADSEE